MGLSNSMGSAIGGGLTPVPTRSILTEGYGNDFVFVMRTTGASETVTIPCQNVGTFNAVIDWGDGQTSDITAYNDADLSHVYATAGDHTIRISGTFPNIYFNNTGHKLKLIRVIQLGKVGWQSLANSFYGCFSGPYGDEYEFAAGNCDTDSVDTMRNMMRNWTSITGTPNLAGLTTPMVTRMGSMMRSWSSMLAPPDLSGIDTSNVTDMSAMLRDWESTVIGRVGVDQFNIASVTNLASFANGCTFTTEAYNEILIAWEAQAPPSGLSVNFGSSTYTGSSAASTARASLVSTYGWTIVDGGTA